MRRATLRDVAQEAGVSLATADRALNRRAGVHPTTLARVEDAARRLDYRPLSAAVRLARGEQYRFCFILPVGTNTFMANLADEVRATAAWFADEGVSVEIRHVDVFDPASLAGEIRSVAGTCRGIAVVALDHPEVREAIDQAVAAGVEVVTLVSDVQRSSRCRFVGIDNVAAGRTAASLLGRFVGAEAGSVGFIVGSLSLRDHAERRFGFEQVMRAEFPDQQILAPRETHDDYRIAEAAVLDLLSAVPDVVAIYNTGAGNRGIAAALEARGRARDIVFVGHDLTQFSRRLLLTGTMDAIVNQDPGHQARSAARILLARCRGEPVIDAQERIRIDIFMRDNLA